jgi:putative ABC transport system substrate-binding protein
VHLGVGCFGCSVRDANEGSAECRHGTGGYFLVSQRNRIAQFAIENKLPSIYTYRQHIEAGGLLAYTPNYHDLFRRAASYVDKILKGTKPGELPIERPTKFHLLINLKTARTLGLTLPLRLLARADELIE